MVKRKITLPRRFVRIESTTGTVAVRGRRGFFKGRKAVKNRGDGTNVIRVIRDTDVDRDGKVDFFGGTIVGRTPKKSSVFVRASNRSKAYHRRL